MPDIAPGAWAAVMVGRRVSCSQLHLLDFEFPTTLIVMMEDRVIVVGNKKKREAWPCALSVARCAYPVGWARSARPASGCWPRAL